MSYQRSGRGAAFAATVEISVKAGVRAVTEPGYTAAMLKGLLSTVLVGAVASATPHAPVAPKARFDVRPAAPRVGAAVTFLASRTHCRHCRYAWHLLNSRRRVILRLGTGRVLRVTFKTPGTRRLRLTATASGRRARVVRRIVVRGAAGGPAVPGGAPSTGAPASPAPGPGPSAPAAPSTDPPVAVGQPSCTVGATPVTSAGALSAALSGAHDVCVTAPVGAVNLDSLTSSATRYVGTSGGGSLGAVDVSGSSNLTFRARMLSMYVGGSDHVTIEESVLGGTSASRTLETLVYLNGSSDVTIRDSELAWTTADNSGNTGYGIRGVFTLDRLTIQRNYIHHIGADGIQLGTNGSDITIDRNEFAYVAPPSTSSEHSDDIQIIDNGPNMRITNNYLHHNGLYAAGQQTGGSGPYIHAGTTNSLLFENNLVRDEENYMQVGNLGTGGCNRSNLTFRRNTFVHNGTMWNGAPDLEWRLCGGSGNRYERNVVNDIFGNESGFAASGTAAAANLTGSGFTIDAAGSCTVAACNPSGQEAIGFRRPSGVPW